MNVKNKTGIKRVPFLPFGCFIIPLDETTFRKLEIPENKSRKCKPPAALLVLIISARLKGQDEGKKGARRREGRGRG